MAKLALLGGRPLREKPWPAWPRHDEREREAAVRVADSGRWQSGPEVEAFEKAFGEYTRAGHAIAMMNGTVTMEAALRAFGIGPGDEVIIPTHTFIATALAVLMVNAVPVFADSEPESYNIDPQEIEKAISGRTKAVIPVHVGGVPCDMDAILAIAKKHQLRILEDAAHAHGSEWRGKRIGSVGDISSFSFQTGKVITSGDGGALTTGDEALAALCRSLREFGYRHPEPLKTSNYRMTEFQAAILQVQLSRLDEQISVRAGNARYLAECLSGIGGLALAARDERVSRLSWYLAHLKYDARHFGGLPKQRFIDAMRAEGAPVSNVYQPLHSLPLFTQRRFGPWGCPVTCEKYGEPIDYRAVSCPVADRAYREEGLWLDHDEGVLGGSRADVEGWVGAVEKVKENLSELGEA
jgi:dTDP-4-amino-4,6-dideoxygalactose transaminase